jgi:hypothetical protein
VLGCLAWKPEAEGDLESAAIAHEVKWTWWEADLLATVVALEEQRRDLEVAEGARTEIRSPLRRAACCRSPKPQGAGVAPAVRSA